MMSYVWRLVGSSGSSGRHPAARGGRRAFRVRRSAPAACPETAGGLGVIGACRDLGFRRDLIWGSPALSKVRLGFALTGAGGAALLACAVVGMFAAGGAARSFAVGRDRAGLALSLMFAVSFIFWSVAVRYSPLIAAIGGLTGGAALWWASSEPDDVELASQAPGVRHPAASVLRVAAGFLLPPARGALFYASLRWGPKTWADPACGATLVVRRSSRQSESQHSRSDSPPALPAGEQRQYSPARSSPRSSPPRYASRCS